MIPTKQAHHSIASSFEGSREMTLSAKALKHLPHILRNEIYSNKPLAVVREYISNALDEHRKHKVGRPVEVWLPSYNHNEFKVRDFGLGLCEEDIYNIFSMYGNSTKDNNNIELGTYGFGSKAGHSYSNTFVVDSYFNNVKSTYLAYLDKDAEGFEVGKIQLVSTSPSQETGIEITVPVNKGDIDKFNKSMAYLYPCLKELDIKRGNIDIIKSFFENEDCIISSHGFMGASMGGIIYRLTPDMADELKKFSNQLNLVYYFNNSLIIKCDIGSLAITPSRELVASTQASLDTLKDKILKIESAIAAEIRKLPWFDNTKDMPRFFLGNSSVMSIKGVEALITKGVLKTKINFYQKFQSYIWYKKSKRLAKKDKNSLFNIWYCSLFREKPIVSNSKFIEDVPNDSVTYNRSSTISIVYMDGADIFNSAGVRFNEIKVDQHVATVRAPKPIRVHVVDSMFQFSYTRPVSLITGEWESYVLVIRSGKEPDTTKPNGNPIEFPNRKIIVAPPKTCASLNRKHNIPYWHELLTPEEVGDIDFEQCEKDLLEEKDSILNAAINISCPTCCIKHVKPDYCKSSWASFSTNPYAYASYYYRGDKKTIKQLISTTNLSPVSPIGEKIKNNQNRAKEILSKAFKLILKNYPIDKINKIKQKETLFHHLNREGFQEEIDSICRKIL